MPPRDAHSGLYELAVYRHTRIISKHRRNARALQHQQHLQRARQAAAVAEEENLQQEQRDQEAFQGMLSPGSGIGDDDDNDNHEEAPIANGHHEEEGECVAKDVVNGAGNGSGIVSLRITSDNELFHLTEGVVGSVLTFFDHDRALSQKLFDLLILNITACVISANAAAAFHPTEWPALVAFVSAACFNANRPLRTSTSFHPKVFLEQSGFFGTHASDWKAVKVAGDAYERFPAAMHYFCQQRPSNGWNELVNVVKDKFGKNKSLQLILYGTLRVVASRGMRPSMPRS